MSLGTRCWPSLRGEALPEDKPDGWHTYHICGGERREVTFFTGVNVARALCPFCGQWCTVEVQLESKGGIQPLPPANESLIGKADLGA